jgi:flagellar hook-associated protein 1 FlgK
MAIFPALDIARRALIAQEAALGVTGSNIANVNTPGYTRQVADLEADPTVVAGGALVGSGVHVRGVRQIVDPLLLRRRLGAESDRGEQTARRDQLGALAGIANDLADPSLTSAVGEFFDAADALARNPAGLPERETLLGRATALAAELNRRSGAIAALQRSVDERLVETATQANDDLRKVAELNRAIVAVEVSGHPANDLRDQRQAVLTRLAGAVGIRTVEEPGGAVTVSAENGAVLVAGDTVVHPIAVRNGAPGLDGFALHDLGLGGPGGSFLAVPAAFTSGTLGGLLAVRDGALATASANLDTFAATLRDAVNAVQTDPAAVDQDGLPTTAVPLFAGTGAGDLAVAITDPRRIAAARSTQPGDNQNALLLADLRTARHAALGDVSFPGWIAGELGRIAEDAAQAKDVAGASELLATHLEEQHLSLSGVNLNEELTNLVKYQHAFGAAAQLVNVTNRLLDDLLDIV